MRNYLKKLNLWQEKRNSLPILDDAQLDWAAMEAILDLQMPQTEEDKKIILLSPPKKLNLLSLMLLSFSAAAMTLVVTHVVKTNQKQQANQPTIHHGKHHKYIDKNGLITIADSLVDRGDTVVFDTVALNSYLFINNSDGKGEVKNETITNNIGANYTPSPLISVWQQNIDINAQYNLKALAVLDKKNIATSSPSNKVIDHATLPLFSNEWLSFGSKNIVYMPDNQLNTKNKIAIDSLTIVKRNSIKEFANTNGNSTSAINGKSISNSAKNNISSNVSPIKTLSAVNAGATALSTKNNLSSNSSAAAIHKNGNNLAVKKANQLKNVPNKVNTIIDTIASSLNAKNSEDDTVSSAYTAKTNNTPVINNKNSTAKKGQKNNALASSATKINNLTGSKAINITKQKIDSVALIAKNNNQPDDSVTTSIAVKTNRPIAKINKNPTRKKNKPTVFASASSNYLNTFPAKNLKFNASNAINTPSGQNSSAASAALDSVIKPKIKAYAALQNKNSRPKNGQKTRNGLKKNKIGTTASGDEEDDNKLLVNQPVIITSVTKKVENEFIAPESLDYGNPTTFYIELTKLKPVGKPKVVDLVNDENSTEEVVDGDLEIANKKLTIFTLLDYGLLFGLNNPDSFYSYNQGINPNGSLPFSPFFGIFANLNLHNQWSISSQIRFMVPRNNAIDYSILKQFSADSSQLLKVNNTRKLYTLDIPLHLVYRLNKNFSFYAGPTISIPLMQINANNRLQTDTIKAGASTYSPYSNIADNSFFSRRATYGISAGAHYQFDRYYIGFMWDDILGGYQINSNYGTAYSKLSSFQVTFGISLKKPKAKTK